VTHFDATCETPSSICPKLDKFKAEYDWKFPPAFDADKVDSGCLGGEIIYKRRGTNIRGGGGWNSGDIPTRLEVERILRRNGTADRIARLMTILPDDFKVGDPTPDYLR
jgi:hypothetical protein